MTNEQAREAFNQMIQAFAERGMADKVAEMEICREYFTNSLTRSSAKRWKRPCTAPMSS